MQNGSDLQQRWEGWREGMGHPRGQNQARDTGEPGLSPRWGFPLRLKLLEAGTKSQGKRRKGQILQTPAWHPAGRSPPARADSSTARLGASPHKGALA